MRNRYLLGLLLALMLTSCGGGGGGQTANIAGTWVGSWSSLRYAGAGGQFIMNLSQSGNSFGGTAQLTNSCFGTLQVTGSLAGNNFIATLSDGGRQRVSVSGTVVGNATSGTYRTLDLTGTNCLEDQGTFSAGRS
jgi:hypothetical protein